MGGPSLACSSAFGIFAKTFITLSLCLCIGCKHLSLSPLFALTDERGDIVERSMQADNLNILNNGASTWISYNIETAIDLTIVSPGLELLMEWSVIASPNDSDHRTIVVTMI